MSECTYSFLIHFAWFFSPGQCYACKNQGVEDLRHPAIDLYEIGSPDASCNLWYTDDESDEEAKATRFESDSLDLGVLFGSYV